METKVRNFEENAWADYCVNHPSMHIAQVCLKNVTPNQRGVSYIKRGGRLGEKPKGDDEARENFKEG